MLSCRMEPRAFVKELDERDLVLCSRHARSLDNELTTTGDAMPLIAPASLALWRSMRASTLCHAALLLTLLSMSTPARSDPARNDPARGQPTRCLWGGADAEELFRQGRRRAEEHDCAAARECFRTSLALKEAVGTLLNLAICEEELGNDVTAREAYQKVLRALPADDPRLPIAQARFEAIDARVPRLTLRLTPDAPAGVNVVHNGIRLPTSALGQELPVAAGRHRLVVAAPGYRVGDYQITLREGERRELAFAPLVPERKVSTERSSVVDVSVQPNHAPAHDRHARTTSALEWGGIGMAATGTVALGVGSYFGLRALDKKRDSARDCDSTGCGHKGLADRAEGRRFGDKATLWVIGGGVLLGVGVTLYALGQSSSYEARRSVVLGVAADGLGVGGRLRGSF